MNKTLPAVILSSPAGVRRHVPRPRGLDAPLLTCTLDERAAPLVAHLAVNGARAGSLAAAQAHATVVRHVLARTPVMIVVSGDVEVIDQVHAFYSALMNVRARMSRDAEDAGDLRRMDEDALRRLLGIESSPGGPRDVVRRGDVYLVHDDGRTARRATIDRVRRCLLPNSFRYRADSSRRIDESAGREWLSVLSGAPSLARLRHTSPTLRGGNASLFADALANLDALRVTVADELAAASARAGSEAMEHRAIKALLASWATARLTSENVLVEERLYTGRPTDAAIVVPRRPPPPRPVVGALIPDVQMHTDVGTVLVEIETLRGIGMAGVEPLSALEEKIRRRVANARESDAAALWLVLPPDCVALAAPPLSEMYARIARECELPIHLFTIDYVAREPVQIFFVERDAAIPFTDNAWASCISHVGASIPETGMKDVLGAYETKRVLDMELSIDVSAARLGLAAVRSVLLHGLPGCGKSHLAKAIAGELKRPLHRVLASDVTSQWLGASVGKIREVFDAVVHDAPCALLIDELDGIAPPRSSSLNMHTDEKKQVTELLAQLDRVRGFDVIVLATTNYVGGIDSAVRRAGRFDLRLAVLPPVEEARREIMRACIPPKAWRALRDADDIDWTLLAKKTCLFTPPDLRAIIEAALRRAVAADRKRPSLRTSDIVQAIEAHSPSVTPDMARRWLDEVGEMVGTDERAALEAEIHRAVDLAPAHRGTRRIGFSDFERGV